MTVEHRQMHWVLAGHAAEGWSEMPSRASDWSSWRSILDNDKTPILWAVPRGQSTLDSRHNDHRYD